MRKARRMEGPRFGAQAAFKQVVLGQAAGVLGLGAMAVGATAVGALAIGALAIRALAVKRGKIGHLNIEDLEVGRLHVGELVVEREQILQESASLQPSFYSEVNGSAAAAQQKVGKVAGETRTASKCQKGAR